MLRACLCARYLYGLKYAAVATAMLTLFPLSLPFATSVSIAIFRFRF